MKIIHSRKFFLQFLLLTTVLCSVVFTSAVSAQKRDYMSDQEIEVVREAQYIDERIDVLTKMVDRRFTALGVVAGGWKQGPKDMDTWGEMPKGTRLELLSDIKKLLQKAIDDIDNLAAHPDAAPLRNKEEKNSKEAKKDPERFSIAVRSLGQSAKRWLAPMKSQLDAATDDKEKGLLLDSIEFCDQIIEAVGKLPAEVKKK
ncbi:MAG: hypothetical protein H0V90_05825 [Blastocatellia bacterium]|nr:hypothetical protein [Blastocatellia bacterium]